MRFLLVLFAVLAWLQFPARAQAAATVLLPAAQEKALSQYRLDGWQIEQGLPQNAVAALLHTSDGYLWVGTLGGLARFDGARFTTFDASEFAEIASQPVLGLMQDAQQNLWIGHNKGAAIYRDGKFRQVFSAGPLGDQRVWAFAQAPDGAVWAATSSGLLRWDKGAVKHYREADGLPTDRLRALAFDRDGVLWIASSGGGLVSFKDGRFHALTPDNGFPICRCARYWPTRPAACGRPRLAADWRASTAARSRSTRWPTACRPTSLPA
ncbi:two-component regulator propeller domain-containing protein [Pseudoduganella sp. UC29_71]|uniref:ligand-binding sensor domain-containing protein n=1 Tax=Pseudoduganella sp. UC29_71 TaxID=3350174 RepID=UPI00366F60DB